MEINKNNYEAFFLDYHEGNLTPTQVADLFLFISQHSELKEEFESFENFSIEDFSSVEFENKSNLKREITLENKEDYFIRAIENKLNTAEKGLLTEYLKEHPQFLTEFELFQKTILPTDDSIVFENKNSLKKSVSSEKQVNAGDEMMISAIEGLLSLEETQLLNQHVLIDVRLKKEFVLFQRTKLSADTTIVFEGKEKLKHKNEKAIPLYYYLSAAAAILLLFGLFFLFNNNETQPKLAEVATEMEKNTPNSIEKPIKTANKVEKKLEQAIGIAAFVVKKEKLKKKIKFSKNSQATAPVEVQNLSITIIDENKEPLGIDKDLLLIELDNLVLPTINSEIIAQVEMKKETEKSTEFISVRDLAVEKIKEKLMDKNAIVAEKKSGRLKKINGWDIAQVFTSGISRLTGRDIELKPYYDEEGTVTAYALCAGEFQISRGR